MKENITKMRVKIIFICKKYGYACKNASKHIFTYNECSTKGSKNIFTYNEASPVFQSNGTDG